MTPKRRLLTLIFACLCFKKSLPIKNTMVGLIKHIFFKFVLIFTDMMFLDKIDQEGPLNNCNKK